MIPVTGRSCRSCAPMCPSPPSSVYCWNTKNPTPSSRATRSAWQVLGPNFLLEDALTSDSRFLDRTFKNWLSQMTKEERSEFFDTVFSLLESTGAERTGEIIRPQNVLAYVKTLKTNESMRSVLASELARLVSSARQTQSDPVSGIPAATEEA